MKFVTALGVVAGVGCAGPERSTGPEWGSPAQLAVAPSLAGGVTTPGKDVGSRDDRPSRRLTIATPQLSGFAIHNRTAADSARGEELDPDQ